MIRKAITVTGIVQGVGFRPFVIRLAKELALTGWVQNGLAGVAIEIEGTPGDVDTFIATLCARAPQGARLVDLQAQDVAPTGRDSTFSLRPSTSAGPSLPVFPPDLATCTQCLSELNDPTNRRHRYPFITCAECGPRLSIITRLPYDRPNTTLASFPLCAACLSEYHDPTDRRFEAQPIACAACGPRLHAWSADGSSLDEAALDQARLALERGQVLLLKGVGGFQLLVDATNDTAVQTLRVRKGRSQKPFAVMFPSLDSLRQACLVESEDEVWLTGAAAPIVILPARVGHGLSPDVAPDQDTCGAFLPYSPLHKLLLSAFGRPVVCTSANLADEPLCTEDEEAKTRLSGVYDCALSHNRPIARPVDDSVVRRTARGRAVWRRARGLAPSPIAFPNGPTVLALGPHQKNTFTLAFAGQAIVSQHIGDLTSPRGIGLLERSVRDYLEFYSVAPGLVACDLHPNYATTHLAETLAKEFDVPLARVQHHHAHAAACMAEHALTEPALAFIWDGAGLGADGRLWGGEALLVEGSQCSHFARFHPFPLPGGERAMRDPRRVLLGLAFAVWGAEIPSEVSSLFTTSDLNLLLQALSSGFCPETTSVGRLFDAVYALTRGSRSVSYEAESASWVEQAAHRSSPGPPYPFELLPGSPLTVDLEPLVLELIRDARDGHAARIPRRLHEYLASLAVAIAARAALPNVVLSGGCFQNQWLLGEISTRLEARGHRVYTPQAFPANDGGISLGQAYLAHAYAHPNSKGLNNPCA